MMHAALSLTVRPLVVDGYKVNRSGSHHERGCHQGEWKCLCNIVDDLSIGISGVWGAAAATAAVRVDSVIREAQTW
jgi:hypothetical protein